MLGVLDRVLSRRGGAAGGAAADGELRSWTHTTIGCAKKIEKGMRRCRREWGGRAAKRWRRGLTVVTGIEETRRRTSSTPASFSDGLAAQSEGKIEGKERGGSGL